MSNGTDSQQPDHHKRITQDHVEAALKADKGEKAKLLSWKIHDFLKKGDNFGSIVTSVNISYCLGAENQNISYIIKLNPEQPFENYKDIMDLVSLKEAEFYDKILPALNKELRSMGQDSLRCPKGIYSSVGIGNDVVFLEDLRPRGFKMHKDKNELDVPHTTLALQELARLHAASLLLKEKCHNKDLAAEYTFLKSDIHNCSEKAKGVVGSLFSNAFDDAAKILERIDGYEAVKKWLTDNKTKTVDMFERQLDGHAPFEVICHGDCWSNNMLFRYDDAGVPIEVMLIDLPLNRKASLATDLNYFMYISLLSHTRKTNLNDFLATYYKAFDQVLRSSGRSMPFTTQDLLQEYKKRHEYGLVFGLYAMILLSRPVEDAPDYTTVCDEEDLNKITSISEKDLDTMSKNARLMPRLLSLLDDMVEYGVIS